MKEVIIKELERYLIQEWRDQNERYTPRVPNYESEEKIEKFDPPKNNQSNDDKTKQKVKDIAEKRMVQLKVMAE